MNIVEKVRHHLNDSSKASGHQTSEVRLISRKLFKTLEDKSIDNVLKQSELLLRTGEWAFWIIAYDWAFRVRKQYTLETYDIFERWLINYVKNWDDCDDFCTHAFGELLSQYNELFTKVFSWTEHQNFTVRRAAAVILIYPIKYNKYQNINPFLISDALMNDSHHLVLKGYGWMLKVLSQFENKRVYTYLSENKVVMPRVSFRYALEKFDSESKTSLMKK